MKNLIYLSLFILAACGKSYESTSDGGSDYRNEKLAMESVDEDYKSEEPGKVERKLIKRGSVTFETQDLDETTGNVKDLTQKYKGYISNEQNRNYGDRIQWEFSVRIPAQSFDAYLTDLSEGVDYFDSKNISVDDVTEQFLDVQARLKTKKALETGYTQLLDKARNVTEILEIERELGKIRADIESMEGRLKYLTNQVSFATLNITFYKKFSKDNRFGSKLGKSFKQGWNVLIGLTLGLVSLWPIIIILFIAIRIVRRFWNKKR